MSKEVADGGGAGGGGGQQQQQFQPLSDPQLQLQQLCNLDTLNQVAIQLQRNEASDAPASVMLRLLNCMLQGGTPDLQEVALVRRAILKSQDVYQPVDMGVSMQSADMDVSGRRAVGGGTVRHSSYSLPILCSFPVFLVNIKGL